MPFAKAMKQPVDKTQHVVKPLDFGDAVEAQDAGQDMERIQIRLTPTKYAQLKSEARETGNTMSGLASLAVSDWLDERAARKASYKR